MCACVNASVYVCVRAPIRVDMSLHCQQAGNIFGYFLLNERPDTALSGELQKTLTEFGMTLVLFFAGLSIQLPDRYLSRVVPVSVWHTLIVAVLFAVIAFASGLCEGRVAVMLFGLTCALSSKTLVDEYLEESDQAAHILNSQHMW